MIENKTKIKEELLKEIQFNDYKRSKYPYNYKNKIPFFDGFTKRYSDTAFPAVRNKLIYFALFLEEKYEIKIREADFDQILDFFDNDIDKRNILKETKMKWRNVINQYYHYLELFINKKAKRREFVNPVPTRYLYEFSEKEITIEDIEKEEDVLTYEIAEMILNRTYIGNRRLFIIVSILLYSGARISEVCGIKLEDIDLEERFFFAKQVKAKKHNQKWGVYFFPKFFVPYLQKWVENLTFLYPDTPYLFPTPKNPLVSINSKTPRKGLSDLKNEMGLKCRINPHAWRDFINTERFDKDLNVKYRSMLLNQTPRNVNVRHYLKKYNKRKHLQAIYDETLPFPEFIPQFLIF